jgi:hypothetical protein
MHKHSSLLCAKPWQTQNSGHQSIRDRPMDAPDACINQRTPQRALIKASASTSKDTAARNPQSLAACVPHACPTACWLLPCNSMHAGTQASPHATAAHSQNILAFSKVRPEGHRNVPCSSHGSAKGDRKPCRFPFNEDLVNKPLCPHCWLCCAWTAPRNTISTAAAAAVQTISTSVR